MAEERREEGARRDHPAGLGVVQVMHDPRDPALQQWLRSLKPRVELTARYALRAKFPAIRADRDFGARIAELLYQLHPDDEELAAILRDAQLVSQAFEPPDEQTLRRRQAVSRITPRARHAKPRG
ncbi:MAG TPA: hypothetical protein VGL83_17585 [Stellaceae bacterium]